MLQYFYFSSSGYYSVCHWFLSCSVILQGMSKTKKYKNEKKISPSRFFSPDCNRKY